MFGLTGVFEPRTGNAISVDAERDGGRDLTVSLEQIVQQWAEGPINVILDNLSVYRSLEVQLWVLHHE